MNKILLIAAAFAIYLPARSEEFYSNAGGYYKLVVPPGYKIIANQLPRGTNTVAELFRGAPSGTIILKWGGAGFLWNQFDGEFNEWLAPEQTLVPGEGAFIYNPTPTNFTFYIYGDILQGNLTNFIPALYSLKSSMLPIAGTLTQLGFPPSPGDVIQRWINVPSPGTDGYAQSTYDAAFLEWDTEPIIDVGEGFFVHRSTGASSWIRTFFVN